MAHFIEVTEHTLRDLSRRATSLYLNPEAGTAAPSPTEAVIKVAAAFTGGALTSEHARRICEMTYHDIFEQSFRGGVSGSDRLVSFDPPDAEKVASAIRARKIDSFSEKTASAPRTGGTSMDKNATAPARRAPPTENAFSRAVGAVQVDRAPMKKEARGTLYHLRDQLREAASSFKVDLAGAAGAEKVAFLDLLNGAVHAAQQGAPPVAVVSACVAFAKNAGSEDDAVLESLATDLLRGLSQRGVVLQGEKVAGLSTLFVNERHPLRAQVIKVAELRGFRVHGEIALSDVRTQLARVERELQDVLYQ
jgi:hypothetical protein